MQKLDVGSEPPLSSEPLPAGWKKKVSKSKRGSIYYVAPDGSSTWTRPTQPAASAALFRTPGSSQDAAVAGAAAAAGAAAVPPALLDTTSSQSRHSVASPVSPLLQRDQSEVATAAAHTNSLAFLSAMQHQQRTMASASPRSATPIGP